VRRRLSSSGRRCHEKRTGSGALSGGGFHGFGRRAGADPIGKEAFNVDLGLMYDPNRRLVWTASCTNQASVLKFDPKVAMFQKLE
jgi:hypothetical protein